MKVLHILYQSLPQISGSSIRSRDLLMSQKEIGLDVLAVTAPFQSFSSVEEVIDGIRYLRTSINVRESISDKKKPLHIRVLRIFQMLKFYVKLKKIIQRENPNILHAHAMFFCGLPALYLGRKFKLPVVYEVRSLWMLNKSFGSNKGYKALIENLLFRVELYVMKRASLVIAINDNLKQELVDRGIEEAKISVIKNAVNTSLINTLIQNLGSNKSRKEGFNFGYIGTLTSHEGIDMLIKTFADLNLEHPNCKLKIYGSGVEEENVSKLAKEYKNVEFLGSIHPSNVPQAFESVDIIVNPRYKNKLTDSVTPLKPLEAMAYEKFFIGSDVGGIKELVEHGVHGYLFKAGNGSDLMDKMIKAMNLEKEEFDKIKRRAGTYVNTHKSWIANAHDYNKIYWNLTKAI
nr:glycosyltransferase family 4 protein [uncultured Allomuricauda sp.]